MKLIIEVDFDLVEDCDYNRSQLVAIVEERVEEMKEEKRISGPVDVGWEVED